MSPILRGSNTSYGNFEGFALLILQDLWKIKLTQSHRSLKKMSIFHFSDRAIKLMTLAI